MVVDHDLLVFVVRVGCDEYVVVCDGRGRLVSVTRAACVEYVLGTLVGGPYVWGVWLFLVVVVFGLFIVVRVKTPTSEKSFVSRVVS